jgi:hypothetical protein
MEAVAGWEDMPPGEKQARLLDQALDRKREILSLPLPDESDDSAEAHRARSLVLAAADSTINQTIALRSSMLSMASDARDAEMEQFIEERRQQALVMIEKMREPQWSRAPSVFSSPAASLRLSRMPLRLRKGRRLGSRALKTWRPRRLPAPWVRFEPLAGSADSLTGSKARVRVATHAAYENHLPMRVHSRPAALTPGAVRAADPADVCGDRSTRQYRHWSRARDDRILAEYGPTSTRTFGREPGLHWRALTTVAEQAGTNRPIGGSRNV